MKKTAPLSTPTSSSSRPGVVGGDLLAELADPRLQASRRRSGPRRPRARARTGSCALHRRLHPVGLDDPGHGDDLVAADHERPAFAVGAGDLGVDEHVLDLLRAAGEPVARPPPADDKAWELGTDAPTAPVDLAAQLDRARARARAGRAPAPPGARRRGRRASTRPARRAAPRAPAAAYGASRASAGRSRAPPDGCRSSSGRISLRISPRVVPAFEESSGTRRRARGRTPRSPPARAGAAGARPRPRGAA